MQACILCFMHEVLNKCHICIYLQVLAKLDMRLAHLERANGGEACGPLGQFMQARATPLGSSGLEVHASGAQCEFPIVQQSIGMCGFELDCLEGSNAPDLLEVHEWEEHESVVSVDPGCYENEGDMMKGSAEGVRQTAMNAAEREIPLVLERRVEAEWVRAVYAGGLAGITGTILWVEISSLS